MATAIDKEFGITAKLKEGHGGIYEVAIDDSVVYSRKKQGGKLPKHQDILQEIRNHTNRLSE